MSATGPLRDGARPTRRPGSRRPRWEDVDERRHAGRLRRPRRWAARYTVAELVEQAQLRRLPFAPVWDLARFARELGAIPSAALLAARIPSPALLAGEGQGEGSSSSPLSDVRVVDFTWVVAGPLATRVLADFGAEVICIERPDAPAAVGSSEANLRRGKRSVALDLRSDAGLAAVRELLRDADVVIDNFSRRVLPNFGLDDDALHALNPRLVIAHLTGFPADGPRADWAAFGPTIQAMAGLVAHMRDDDGRPAGPGFAYADTATGWAAALAIALPPPPRPRQPPEASGSRGPHSRRSWRRAPVLGAAGDASRSAAPTRAAGAVVAVPATGVLMRVGARAAGGRGSLRRPVSPAAATCRPVATRSSRCGGGAPTAWCRTGRAAPAGAAPGAYGAAHRRVGGGAIESPRRPAARQCCASPAGQRPTPAYDGAARDAPRVRRGTRAPSDSGAWARIAVWMPTKERAWPIRSRRFSLHRLLQVVAAVRRALLAYESKGARAATDLAIQAVGAAHRAMDFVASHDPHGPTNLTLTEARDRGLHQLEELRTKRLADYPNVELVAKFGAPAESAMTLAKERGADIIVTAVSDRHARNELSEILHDSVSQSLTRHAPCPVLVVPPHAK
jgi:nucleotide-binding universal stress UspA family protein